jgi:hypothetical protein
MKDQLEELIDAAHDLYGDYSISKVMDLSRPAAIAKMVEMYGGSVVLMKIESYFAILERIRECREQTAPGPLGRNDQLPGFPVDSCHLLRTNECLKSSWASDRGG